MSKGPGDIFFRWCGIMQRKALRAALVFAPFLSQGQADSNTVITFDFNDHTYREASDLLTMKPVGVTLVEDRFGNERSAVFLNGHLQSYLNLGVSPLLKPRKITFSIWVNLSRRVYAGKGFDSNPILMSKNGPQDDFCNAYVIALDNYSGRLGAGSSKDSLTEAIVCSVNKAEFGRWYHLAFTADNKWLTFYINGNLQGRCKKDFETIVMDSDSMVIGHSANKKNERFSMGVFDDIRIFHRVLSEKEIKDLYAMPDPNKSRVFWTAVIKWATIFAAVFTVSFLLVWQRRRALTRAREKLDTKRHLHDLEIRTLKAQMNPHFIFNALNSIQQFIMSRENDKAELYLSEFSKLIRRLLEGNTKESLTIKEEVEIIEGYLNIESLRFGGSFSYSVSVDEAVGQEHTEIPHMMIQPFIENAIWHGLLSKENDRKLEVIFRPGSDKTICCIVDDNGIGREKSMLRENTFKRKSLALSFVRQRLELLGETLNINCSVTITDKKNEQGSLGTKVTIVLPILNK